MEQYPQELRDYDRLSRALNNLGGYTYLDGRWDEALELAERAREACLEQPVTELAHGAQFEQAPEFRQRTHRAPYGDRCAGISHENHVLVGQYCKSATRPTVQISRRTGLVGHVGRVLMR